MSVDAIIWIVVIAVVVLVGLGALREFNRERALQCSRCGRSGPFPEREMMALREGRPACCPDCGNQLARRRANGPGHRPDSIG
jgi:DNA-directed RNA polymerase subunit RPC12/RpoP